MILYIENLKGTTKKLLELINKFSKYAGYKIISFVFLCTNYKLSEIEIKKIFTNHLQSYQEKILWNKSN